MFLSALATCVLCGGKEAELEYISDTGSERGESATKVSGTGVNSVPPSLLWNASYSQVGATTVIRSGALELTVFGEPEVGRSIQVSDAAQRLLGTWPGQDEPTVLALAQYSLPL